MNYTLYKKYLTRSLTVVVYGMGVDLATVLAVMGTVWGGNPLSLDPSFSIGGKDTGVENLLGNWEGFWVSDCSHCPCIPT